MRGYPNIPAQLVTTDIDLLSYHYRILCFIRSSRVFFMFYNDTGINAYSPMWKFNSQCEVG